MSSKDADIDAMLAQCNSEEQATAAELQIVQNSIDTLQNKIAILEDLRTKEETGKEKLTADLHRINARRAFLLNLRRPVWKLPDEVLADIFKHGVSSFEGGDREPKWSELAEFLKSIGCVTRRWRNVALGTPRLWRNILQSLPAKPKFFPIQACMERSGAIPLRVWVEHKESLLRLLTFAIQAPTPRFLLQLNIRYMSIDSELVRCLSDLGRVRVDWVTLESCNMDIHNLRPLPMPLLGPLSSARRVRFFQCRFNGSPMPSSSAYAATFPALQTLELVPHFSQDIGKALSLLSAPRLKQLFIAIPGHSPPIRDDLILLLPPGSLASVEFLILGGRMTAGHMLSVMEHTPNVFILGIVNITPSQRDLDHHGASNYETAYGDVLHSLSNDLGVALLPQLRHVAFHQSVVSLDSIHELIDSRSQHSPIRSISFNTKSKRSLIPSQSQVDRLRAKVKVSTWEPPDIATIDWPR